MGENMHPDKIWIVIVILIVILAGSNLIMFAAARGFREIRFGRSLDKDILSHPWKKENDKLKELNQRVKDLQNNDKK